MSLTERWIVTHSPNRFGSITVSQTRWIGASIVIVTWTLLMRGSATGLITCRREWGARVTSHSDASQSRSARSIAASSECSLTSSSFAARSSRGSRSSLRLSINGSISAGSSLAIFDETTLAIGVSDVLTQADRRPVQQHVVADPVDQLAVGDGVGTTDIQRLAAHRVADGRPRQQLEHVPFVDRAGDVRPPRRHDQHREPFDEADQETKRSRPRPDHDRGPEGDGIGARPEQYPLDLEPAGDVHRRRSVARHETAEVHDSLGARRLGRAREVLGRGALARRRSAPLPEGSIEWIRKYATSTPASASRQPSPLTASPRTTGTSSATRPGSRANPTIWCPSRCRRGVSCAPT